MYKKIKKSLYNITRSIKENPLVTMTTIAVLTLITALFVLAILTKRPIILISLIPVVATGMILIERTINLVSTYRHLKSYQDD